MKSVTTPSNTAIAERFQSFRAVTEAGKGELEREHRNRQQRYQRLDAHVEKLSDSTAREAALRKFAEREEQGLAAKAKVWTTADFQQVGVLGEGGFGVVRLVRRVGTEEYFALKQMRKDAYRKKNHRARVFAERNLLAERRSRWFVELLATFQDAEHIYMAMEFLQGGDLYHHLQCQGPLTPHETCFYMAELLEALDTVHRSGFVHRDVKPDNIMLSAGGHLKLLDFGLCVDWLGGEGLAANDSSKPLRPLNSLVGTPQYMAPEILDGEYGPEVDIWSFGVLTFECLTGQPVLYLATGDFTVALDCLMGRLRRHKETVPLVLHRAREFLPPSAEQLLLAVLCDRGQRLSIADCRDEPFFAGIDFARVHLQQPPIKIEVTAPSDTRHFSRSDVHAPLPKPDAPGTKALEWGRYEYDRRAQEFMGPEVDWLSDPDLNAL